jgi:GAF domain
MPFAAGLRESLEMRGSQVPSELTRGDSLEHVLSRHLQTVEQMGGGELVTSILLLSDDGKRLSHGAGPRLPISYRAAIDGSEIGPRAGSCGTAAYFGKPVYVADIGSDPLWAEYRQLALPHGFRSCWSTPIRGDDGSILGTFAIYHDAVGAPSEEEIRAIDTITGHVAHAILCARGVQDLEPAGSCEVSAPRLKLVHDNEAPEYGLPDRLLANVERIAALTTELDRHAEAAETEDGRAALRSVVEDIRRLIDAVRQQTRLQG